MKNKIKISENDANFLISFISEKTKEILEIQPEPIKHLEDTAEAFTEFKITFGNKCVYVNKIQIIDEKTEWINCVFRILFEQRLKDIGAYKNKKDYTFLNIKQITKLLETSGKNITNTEQQIRWPIHKIRKRIKEVFDMAGINDFIESRRSKGTGDKSFGYRLNPFIIFI